MLCQIFAHFSNVLKTLSNLYQQTHHILAEQNTHTLGDVLEVYLQSLLFR